MKSEDILEIVVGILSGFFIIRCVLSNDILSAVKYGFTAIYCFISFAMSRLNEKLKEVLGEE